MAARVVEIADAVADALNGASLSQSFDAERAYLPVLCKQDEEGDDELAGLVVTVVARELSLAMLDRSRDDYDYQIDVGIQKRLGSGTMTDAEVVTACDPLMGFVEEVADLFRGRRLTIAYDEGPLCVAVANAPIYDPESLEKHRVFLSVVRLTFREARAR